MFETLAVQLMCNKLRFYHSRRGIDLNYELTQINVKINYRMQRRFLMILSLWLAHIYLSLSHKNIYNITFWILQRKPERIGHHVIYTEAEVAAP